MPNNKNVETVSKLREKLTGAKSVVFAEYHGLSANQVNELRNKIKESGGEMSVAKNSLVKIALKEEKLGSAEVDASLEGPVATFISYEDAIAPIKVLAEFSKKINLPKMKAGIVDGVFTSFEKLQILSQLPSREQLLARVVGGMKAPLSGFVNVVGGTRRNLVYVLSAIADKKKA